MSIQDVAKICQSWVSVWILQPDHYETFYILNYSPNICNRPISKCTQYLQCPLSKMKLLFEFLTPLEKRCYKKSSMISNIYSDLQRDPELFVSYFIPSYSRYYVEIMLLLSLKWDISFWNLPKYHYISYKHWIGNIVIQKIIFLIRNIM